MNLSSFSSPTSSPLSLRSTNVIVSAQYLLLFIALLFIAGTLAYYAYPLFLSLSISVRAIPRTALRRSRPVFVRALDFLPKKAGYGEVIDLIVSCVRLAAGWASGAQVHRVKTIVRFTSAPAAVRRIRSTIPIHPMSVRSSRPDTQRTLYSVPRTCPPPLPYATPRSSQ
jgi:hypothetical protein